MKTLIYSLMILFSFQAHAQVGSYAPWMENFSKNKNNPDPTFEEIVSAFENYWKGKDHTAKGSGYKPFKRWQSLNEGMLNPDGTVMTSQQRLKLWEEAKNTAKATDESDWYSVGPLNHINTGSWSSGQGRVNVVAIDPADSNIMFIGAPAGGLWRSTDAGNTWEPLSDEFAQMGVSSIAIDPTNTDVIYIGTGDDDAGDTDAIGIWKSTDGGDTWKATGLDANNSPNEIPEIYISPADNNILLAATSSGVFRSTDGGENWTNNQSGDFFDLKLKPGEPDTVYAVTADQFFKSSDNGITFSQISNGLPTNNGRMAIDVTAANPELAYILIADNGFGFDGIYKSTDSGENFSLTSAGVGDIFESTQAWYDMAFAVSDSNEDEIYTGVLNVWKSEDGGSSFTKVNNWSEPAAAAYTHADIHFLRFIDGKLYCGSDGGVYFSEDSGTNFTSLTEGLAIGQFYRISVAAQDSQKISGGLQDNGGYARNNTIWQNFYGADGMESAIDPNNPDRRFGFIQNGGGIYRTTDGGASLEGSLNGPTNGNWITPLEFTKEGRLLAGYDSLYELDLCTNTWTALSARIGTIDRLATDPNNDDIVYVSTGTTLRRSTDGGLSFSRVDNFPRSINWIEVNQENSDIVYITTAGTNGQVFKGEFDGDNFTQTDITGTLPNVPKIVIKHQAAHSDNPLFLGTNVGVWRFDDVTNEWETFDNGLPNTIIRDLEINTLDGNITAGTYGRGIWQTAIPQKSADIDASIVSVNTSGQVVCGAFTPSVTIKNNGNSALTAIPIEYTIEGVTNTFNWSGALDPNQTITIDLPVQDLAHSTYTVSATIENLDDDAFASNNEGQNSLAVTTKGTGNETNDFENPNKHLLIAGDSFNEECELTTVWERGTPSGTLLNQTSSGTNAYATILDGNHPDNVKQYLYTSCYDLSEMTAPTLSFQMAFDLELDWDILYMEYSTDSGNSWNILGSAADTNWYNSDTAQGENNQCFNCPGNQWTGTDATLKEYSYDLASLTTEENVLFRFVFHSDQNTNQEGVVIDDFAINAEALSNDEFNIDTITIYPNPSKGVFNIALPNIQEASLTVYDIAGKQIVNKPSFEPNNSLYPLDLSTFASGIYILKANIDGTILTRKLIVN